MKRGLKGVGRVFRACGRVFVAEYSPMKRGLKGKRASFQPSRSSAGCRVFPDEEGTERLDRKMKQILFAVVAEYSPMKRGLKELDGLRIYDEASLVAEYSPMKRGLKAPQHFAGHARTAELQSIPR